MSPTQSGILLLGLTGASLWTGWQAVTWKAPAAVLPPLPSGVSAHAKLPSASRTPQQLAGAAWLMPRAAPPPAPVQAPPNAPQLLAIAGPLALLQASSPQAGRSLNCWCRAGEAIGSTGWKLVRIAPDRVILTGPGGLEVETLLSGKHP